MPKVLRQLLRILMVLAITTPLTLAAVPARADDTPSSWNLADYTMHATVDKDGYADVSLEIGFDFGSDSGHGPFIVLPARQPQPNDPDHWRELQLQVKGVSSPTGADTAIKTETKDNHLVLRIGSKGKTYTGIQRYRIDYRMHGITTPDHPESHLDEINWNAVGPAWQVPIKRAKVMIDGPAAPTKTACFTGRGFKQPCQSEVNGNTITYSAQNLSKNTGVQAVAGYPVGTFTSTANAQLSKRYHLGNVMPVTPISVGASALLSVAGLAAVVARVRRQGRDRVYAGVVPGLIPDAAEAAPVSLKRGRTPIAVQFTPPEDARPGELGTLIDEKADTRDVTGTILDLAVRGHLKIEEVQPKEWAFIRQRTSDPLATYENALLGRLFQLGSKVTTEGLKDPQYATLITKSKEELYERVTERNWFSHNPKSVRTLAVIVGGAVMVGGVGLGALLGFLFGLGLVGAAGVVTGLAIMLAAPALPSRTPTGSAMLAQTKGFEKYLATAEADQIKFEEGIDVFSRYLPYAIVFGVAERWTKVFQELAQRGVYQADTSWYYSPYGTGFYYGSGFGQVMDSLSASMESALAESVKASMQSSTGGGSGFSGGGGFGGGGGGGW